ncbi:polysaccharide biosynthesis/export family protein [Roseobacter sp. EG26]|uniref:polysaccharide biosynthesis/export family protein n=1 Tax=Roseobacter sp. EG26 TaxID=3412477 RepID=UPI00260740D0|nr:polysaccharide biosynthesis/export family protein [uncultured Roseobacter sp.]
MKLIPLLSAVMAFVICAVSANAQGDYRIRSGDVLQVEVLEDPSLDRAVVVLPSGQISFPFAGTLTAGGRTISQVQISIRDAISSNFASPPTVFVGVQPRQDPQDAARTGITGPSIDVYFVGEVNNPGMVVVKRGTTLLQAIAISGGVSRFAAIKRVQLRRTDRSGVQRVTILNYKALANGAVTNDIELKDGDVILVPERRLFE